jgi:hypothetical protein
MFNDFDIQNNVRYTFGGVWLIYINIVSLECGRMRGRNQYDYIRRVLFKISSSRGFSKYIDVGGNPKNFRNILNRHR